MPDRRTDSADIRISIESPCTESWDGMTGDEQKRFCAKCSLHVHNLREMPKQEIRELVNAGTEEVCVQIDRLPNGSVVTKEDRSPTIGIARRFYRTVAAGILASLGFLASCGHVDPIQEPTAQQHVDIKNRIGAKDPRIAAEKIRELRGRVMLMGKVCLTPSPEEENK
jgi:hypothetical protein